jgi:hypothetical protein
MRIPVGFLLNRKLSLAVTISVVTGFLCCPVAAQVPPNTTVFKDLIARFETGAEPVRVLFYSYQPRQHGVGFVVISRSGKVLANADIPEAISEDPQTGIYDVTGEGSPDIILIGWVGATTFEIHVYSFKQSRLTETFNNYGWSFEVMRSKGQPIIALTPTDYGTLPQFYKWKQGQFVESDQEVPELFEKAIKLQQDNIERGGFPAYVYAQACELGATALVYGKKYSQANDFCQRALKVVESSPDVIPNLIRPSPGELERERQQAAAQIQGILNALRAAERQGSSNLKQH